MFIELICSERLAVFLCGDAARRRTSNLNDILPEIYAKFLVHFQVEGRS